MVDSHLSLEYAIQHNDPALAARLLEQGHPLTKYDFVDAVERSAYPMLQLFLAHSYDINTPIKAQEPSALVHAYHDIALTKWLLEKGADPNARCHFDITPLSIAAQSAPLNIIKLLFEYGASTSYGSPLHFAARAERPDEVLEYLIEQGASVNALMFDEHDVSFCHYKDWNPLGTPLHEAAEKNNRRVFDLLCRHGADPGIKNTVGRIASISEASRL